MNIYDIADQAYSPKLNTLRINKNESLAHLLSKFFIMYEQVQNGNDTYSELILRNNVGRCDVFVPGLGAFEVTESEKRESIEEKKERYPCAVTEVKAEKVVRYWMDKLKLP